MLLSPRDRYIIYLFTVTFAETRSKIITIIETGGTIFAPVLSYPYVHRESSKLTGRKYLDSAIGHGFVK